MRVLGRYASNPELDFTWYDAAVLSQKIRQESGKLSLDSKLNLPLPSKGYHFDTDDLDDYLSEDDFF